MGVTLSNVYDQFTILCNQFNTLIFHNLHLSPYYPLSLEDDNDSDIEEEVFMDMIFRSLKDHPDIVKQLITREIGNSQYDQNIIDCIASFVDKYIDKTKLRSNTFSKKVWNLKYKTTNQYIAHIFRDAIEKKVSFGKLIQYIIQNTVIDEFSGFTIHDSRTSRLVQGIRYMNQIKHKNIKHHISKAFDGVEEGVMFVTEYDHPPVSIDGIDFLRIDMCGNRSKAIYSKNVKIEMIPFEKIYSEITRKHKRKQYIVDCMNNKDVMEMFCLYKVEMVYYLCVHLKSIGSREAARKNVPLYITMKCIVDWLKELCVEFFFMGDFNIPFLHEDTYIGFKSNDFKWHPIQDPPKEHCLNYEMTRISPEHKDTIVLLKKRTSDITKNAQASIGKYYEDGREGLTDFVFHYLPKTQEQLNWCESKYDETEWKSTYSPQTNTIKSIPYIDNDVENSFCSDHQMLLCKNNNKLIGTWNVLSMDCSSPAAYNSTMTADDIENSNNQLSEIIYRVYKTM